MEGFFFLIANIGINFRLKAFAHIVSKLLVGTRLCPKTTRINSLQSEFGLVSHVFNISSTRTVGFIFLLVAFVYY